MLLLENIKQYISNNEEILCCILGDIVDKGEVAYYKEAKILIKLLKEELEEFIKKQIHFIIVPGNHDLCKDRTLDSFNRFLNSLNVLESVYSDKNMINEFDFHGYHFIALSSVKGGNYDYGEIDFEELEKCKVSTNTIVLVHHSLISSDNKDNAVIRNGYELQRFLEEHNIIALLHGHTHGCKRYSVGHNCQVIGVGPMFKEVRDISNQCNLIKISGEQVDNIFTFTYHGDRNEWDGKNLYSRTKDNNYYGEKVYVLYEKFLKDIEAYSVLQNVSFKVKQNWKNFEKDIKQYFDKFLLEAKEWQSFSCNEKLPYTHVQLMNMKERDWSDFVINRLQNNPTNKRTIIPLITKEQIIDSIDNELVSFDVVQFGFTDELKTELNLAIYMRALEVKNFFPINICEVYLMIKKIKEKLITIKDINFCFFIFQAQYKDSYGCYKKARLDLITESNLCKLIVNKSFDEISQLLLEKVKMKETVINEKGLMNLNNALNTFYENQNKQDVCDKLKECLDLLNCLKNAREISSNYKKTEDIEKEFESKIDNLIKLLV